MKKPPDDRITVRLGPDLYAQLQSYAWQYGNGRQLDFSGILRDALRDYLTVRSRLRRPTQAGKMSDDVPVNVRQRQGKR